MPTETIPDLHWLLGNLPKQKTEEEIEQSLAEQFAFGVQAAEQQRPRPLTYLASPYSSPDGMLRLMRYEINIHATAYLITTQGWNVFSPIVHSHPLAVIAGMNGDWNFWREIDRGYLQVSERLVVLRLPGWEESIGVTAERHIAHEFGIPTVYLEYATEGVPSGPENFSFKLHE